MQNVSVGHCGKNFLVTFEKKMLQCCVKDREKKNTHTL